MSNRVVKNQPIKAVGKVNGDPSSTFQLINALEGARQLKARFAEDSEDFEIVANIEQVLSEELRLSEAMEEFAASFVEGLSKCAPTGDPKAVRRFLNAGIAVVKSQFPHNQR